jgi:hypothetical protein
VARVVLRAILRNRSPRSKRLPKYPPYQQYLSITLNHLPPTVGLSIKGSPVLYMDQIPININFTLHPLGSVSTGITCSLLDAK